VRCEVVAIGSELLLGQIVDTNSSWIGEQLALAGIDSHFQVKVGDNQARIVAAVRQALARSEAVICCGGLGPTQDDITRESIAEVMNVSLEPHADLEAVIRELFAGRGRAMSANNLRQALVPDGATVIPQTRGTAPGLICPLGDRVIYAVPGVPHEMRDMIGRAVLPDLASRAGERATIRSRTLRTWGLAESALAERVAPRLDALEATGNPTIAFLASGVEGIKVRVTAKGTGPDATAVADGLLASEETELRALLGGTVFGVDDENMEVAVGRLLLGGGLTLAVAESLTGGLMAARLTAVPGASAWFRGGQRDGRRRDGRGDRPSARRRRRPGRDGCGRSRRAGGPAGRHRLGRAQRERQGDHRRLVAARRSRAGPPDDGDLGPRPAPADPRADGVKGSAPTG
jgi:nicotinamide-nucleotide amidase